MEGLLSTGPTPSSCLVFMIWGTDLLSIFQKNLILGAWQQKFPGTANFIGQSRASATNVNVFSELMNISSMVKVTSLGQHREGDIVSWSKATWTFSGRVEKVIDHNTFSKIYFPHLFRMEEGFESWHDCMNLCPRIQKSGRVPQALTKTDAVNLYQQRLLTFGNVGGDQMVWAPFSYQGKDNFTDYYDHSTTLPTNRWMPGQPNGGTSQPCTVWFGSNPAGNLLDSQCTYLGSQKQCLCQFEKRPILRMRGLCKWSKVDTHYVMTYVDGHIVFMGLKGTQIRLLQSPILRWRATVVIGNVTASTLAESMSFALGRQIWNIIGDSTKFSMLSHTSRP